MRDRFAPMQAGACGDERFPFSEGLFFYVSALKFLSVFTVSFMADPLSGEKRIMRMFSIMCFIVPGPIHIFFWDHVSLSIQKYVHALLIGRTDRFESSP